MKQIFVSTIILVIFMFPFSTVVKANEGEMQDFKEFDSFQKRYHEHVMEVLYYVNASYNSNDHYFKENFDVFRDAVNQIYDTNKSEFATRFMDSAENLLSKPIALMSTANDLRKYMWEKFKSFFGKEEQDPSLPLSRYDWYTLLAPQGYEFYYSYDDVERVNESLTVSFTSSSKQVSVDVGTYRVLLDCYDLSNQNCTPNSLGDTEYTRLLNLFNSAGIDINLVKQIFLNKLGSFPITLRKISDYSIKPIYVTTYPPATDSIVNNVINNYSPSETLKDYTATATPQLVCPDEVIPLTYQLGTFKTLEGEVVTVSEDETANYLQTLCNLDFKFPEVYYHDETSSIVIDGKPLVPANTDGYDYSIVEYIRNSYNYATTVVSSGVNGLKSIVNGTTGLIAFSGSLFGFLPPELMTLFIGGFSIALGLWVFKK